MSAWNTRVHYKSEHAGIYRNNAEFKFKNELTPFYDWINEIFIFYWRLYILKMIIVNCTIQTTPTISSPNWRTETRQMSFIKHGNLLIKFKKWIWEFARVVLTLLHEKSDWLSQKIFALLLKTLVCYFSVWNIRIPAEVQHYINRTHFQFKNGMIIAYRQDHSKK